MSLIEQHPAIDELEETKTIARTETYEAYEAVYEFLRLLDERDMTLQAIDRAVERGEPVDEIIRLIDERDKVIEAIDRAVSIIDRLNTSTTGSKRKNKKQSRRKKRSYRKKRMYSKK